jgi:hypothetical protein
MLFYTYSCIITFLVLLGFIAPNGDINVQGSMDCLQDPRFDIAQGFLYPSTMAHPTATEKVYTIMY